MAKPLQRRLASRRGLKARKRRAEAKKKARRSGDVPSNRTFGNCLLGFHCSQNDRAGTRANAGFPAVAGVQQQKLCTAYLQSVRRHGTPEGRQISADAMEVKQLVERWILDSCAPNPNFKPIEVKGHSLSSGKVGTDRRWPGNCPFPSSEKTRHDAWLVGAARPVAGCRRPAGAGMTERVGAASPTPGPPGGMLKPPGSCRHPKRQRAGRITR